MDNQVLVVIDMQYGFDSAQDQKTVDQVLIAIDEAIQLELPIIILEINKERNGATLDCIVDAVEFYDNVHFVDKKKNNGAFEVERVLDKYEIPAKEYIVCGVNISACIKETVQCFVNIFHRNIIVLKSACNCHTIEDGWREDKEEAFKEFPIFSNDNVTLSGYPD
jgi:nicotinamidase-related amidase